MRLIDANALIASVEGNPFTTESVKSYLRVSVKAMPTVDAVPVVRCKDCKYCYAEGFVNVRNVCEKHYDFGNVDDDWFCADGERQSE